VGFAVFGCVCSALPGDDAPVADLFGASFTPDPGAASFAVRSEEGGGLGGAAVGAVPPSPAFVCGGG
jgi:hypothetical protein